MIAQPTSTLRRAVALLRPRLILQQIGLGLLIFLLSIAWLRIPDASILDILATILLGLILLAAAGAGEAWIILRLAGTLLTPKKLLRGALLILAGVALWFAWSALIDTLRTNDGLRAGYFNSKFPASLRNLFSYEHLYAWLELMWSALTWIGTGLLAIFVFAATASIRPLRAILRATRSLTFWIVAVLGSIAATTLTNALVEWVPGRTLRVELLSLILRLTLATLLDATIVCLVLAVLAACVQTSDAPYTTPAGTPDASHPRTAGIP